MLYVLLLLGLAAALFRVWYFIRELQRQQAEDSLRASEGGYEAFAEAVPIGIFRSNDDGQCSYVNERWCQITGHTPELVAANWLQTLHPDDRTAVSAEWAQSIQENRPTQIEYRIQRPDGTVVWVYGQMIAERDASGQMTGYVGTLTDIDDRKRSEQALQQSEAHHRALVTVLPDLIMRISRDGVFLEFLASPNFQVLGQPADWIGTHVADMLPPEIAQKRLAMIEQVLQTQRLHIYEQDFSIDGRVQVEEVRMVPYGEDEVLLLVRDVSDRKQAEQDLQHSEAKSQAIIAAIPDYLVCIGTDGVYRELVAPTRDFALIPMDRLIGRRMDEVLPADLAHRQQYFLERALRTGDLQVYEQTVQVGNRIQEEEVRVVKSGADEALFIIRDIGDHKRVEKALQQKLQQEKTLNQVVQAIRNSLDLATIFTTAAAETAQLADLNCAVVQYFRAESLWKVVAKAGSDVDSPTWLGLEISDIDNPFAAQLKQFQMVRVEDTEDIADSVNQTIAAAMPGAWLLIPLVVEGKIWGSFTLSILRHGYCWKDELIDLARAVACQLEVAIQQAQLYQQVEQEKQKLLVSQTALSQAQQIAQMGSWEIDLTTQSMSWSDNLFHIFGLNPTDGEPSLTDFMDYIYLDDQPLLTDVITRAITEGIPYEIDLRIVTADGSIRHIESRGEALTDKPGQVVKVCGTSLDISDRKQAEAIIQRNEQRFRNMAANVPGVIIQYALYADGSDAIAYASPGCYELWELTPEESVADVSVVRDLVHAEDRPAMQASILASAQTLEPWIWQYRIITPSGRAKWLEATGRPERHDNGDVVWDTLILDASDRVRAEEQLKHHALYDSLTKLPNRILLLERLGLSLALAKRHPNYQFAVLFLDLDNFKVINDSLGHIAGDELLLKVANVLTETIRETDLATRLGGDEFVVLLDGLDNIREAEHIAERILSALQVPLQVAAQAVFISTSVGIAIGTESYRSAEELLRDSDLAMYQAKRSGRGQYAVFEPAMYQSAVQRLQIENDLRKALEDSEFVLYYQPVICLSTQTIQGFEALVRWQHPQRGCLLPAEFVEVAEEAGLIESIGAWVLSSACKQLSLWQAQFPDCSLKISVNLSVKQLKTSLLQQLDLVTPRIQPCTLVLEITESMVVQNFNNTVELLQQIKARDVCISIDDFGTGYSSLSYLHQFPLDSLKIDRTFISPVRSDDRNRVIAESIITLSNLLKLDVIAEGIETAQQLAWLKGLGCELGQGNFFSPPASAEQATRLIHTFHRERPTQC
ncbi:MAG: EAL domain-containing protein [Phormidesmis sp.]